MSYIHMITPAHISKDGDEYVYSDSSEREIARIPAERIESLYADLENIYNNSISWTERQVEKTEDSL